MPSYTEISKPAVPTYESVPKVGEYMLFVFQDGIQYAFQDDIPKIFDDISDDIYSAIVWPTVPTYNEITKPS